jgi:hypothetical protein
VSAEIDGLIRKCGFDVQVRSSMALTSKVLMVVSMQDAAS